MPNISVRTGQTTGTSPIGETLLFDFTSDVNLVGGQVLAYGVALSGFLMNYQTNSSYWAENMGLLAVNLVPNLVGNQLFVTANAVMTDYDGDAGLAPTSGDNDIATIVQVTAIALIGSANSNNEVVLGNFYSIDNGSSTPSVGVGSNSLYGAFLSGFSVAAGGSPGSISGLSMGLNGTASQDEFAAKAAISVAGMSSTTASVDVMVLSTPSAVSNFAIQTASISLGSPDGQNGMSGSLQVTFNVPSGQSILNAGILTDYLNIVYSDQAEFRLISATYSNFNINGDTVTADYTLNIFNPDFGAKQYISSESSVNLYVIAQFGSS